MMVLLSCVTISFSLSFKRLIRQRSSLSTEGAKEVSISFNGGMLMDVVVMMSTCMAELGICGEC